MKKLFIIALTALTITACNDELELSPQQSLSDELAFSDALAAEGVLIGAYNLLQDIHVFGSQPQVVADYQTDNVNFVGSFTTLQQINNYSVNADNGTVSEVWQDHYEAILAANAVIANVPGIEDPALTDDLKNQLVGEATFIRALCYFNLVNYYAQPYQVANGANLAVPLVLEPFTGEVILYERSSLEAVHQQIITDLNQVRELLPAKIEQGRASSTAATALLSRLRLYRGEWEQAASLANEVIGTEGYALATDYSFYNSVSVEHIFTIENTEIDFENQSDEESGSGSWDSYYEPNNQGGRGDAPFSSDLMSAFEEESGDLRYQLKEKGTTFSGDSAIFTTKYDDGALNSSDPSIIRVSEMVLNRAEALAELNGINQESIDLMNLVRERAGLTAWNLTTFDSKDALLEAIAVERRKELCFEGHRRMDLLRRGLPLRTEESIPESAAPIGAGIGVKAGDNNAIFPIPQRERDLNPDLEQNPGF
ncbi:RagB/SusD family nutrient uptake outer membrane protein [Porifericola rhodea]|uniref:RagB/SusD family nutrient uptake outer membrane protein n=1 Tax=Porifericola rhodea TaxID=930972 RepID=UPI00266607F9|nr:RagB/SusD family nutrient uptake outer membrane protein [Porifericola rhodea]WKN29669.1 RagB/SusD family nutrient uptake outer membrane protein [Porifericola rhodea]